MKLTNEQENILLTSKKSDQIKIFAFAGTGKTTTLNEIAKNFPTSKILYLAFNKSIEKEAKRKFPKNVEIKTVHALAYRYVGRNFEIQNLNTAIVADLLNMDYMNAYDVISNFEIFCNSDALNINELDLTFYREVKTIYQKMKDKEIPANHSFYLKEFQLKLANKEIKLNYDIVLLDEAQDTNPVTFSIFNLINAKKKIAVGDMHQQIYAFRGAINALDKFDGKECYLTNSFRFNDQIAKSATGFLNLWKNEKNEIKGLGSEKEIKTKAILSRTNSYLIEQIASFLEDNITFKLIREPYSVFGLSLNLLRLKNGENLDKQFSYLSKYNYDDLLESKQEEDFKDIELKSAINIVEKYNRSLIGYYMKAKDYFYNKSLKPQYYLSTAHTSKGLEWDEVTLMEDFNSLYKKIAKLIKDKNTKIEPYKFIKSLASKNYNGLADLENEINLFYVAYTRAKVNLINLSGVSYRKDEINQAIKILLIR